MQAEAAYEELVRRSRELALLGSCASLLNWEQETYMPHGGSENRGEQLAMLAGISHEKRTDPKFGELLATVESSNLVRDPLSVAAVNAREWRRKYDLETKLPRDLVEELAKTTSVAQKHWAAARKAADFSKFKPWLEKIVGLKRRETDAIGFKEDRYDALLDQYEPGAKTKDLTELFRKLREELAPFVAAIAASSRKPDLSVIERDFPVDRQALFGESGSAACGFDFTKGRLDVTTHPFCSGIGPGDCRITTRYNPRDFGDGFFSILHETGHGLYEQGLLPEHFGTPMGEAASLGIHESQSRMWENAVGRSVPFWKHFFPRAKQMFSALSDVNFDAFFFAINSVQPSLIRVDADEVTYNLHVAIRFELEPALLSGDLPVADLPGAWNEKYTKYLGVTPPDDSKGCLQDIHWSLGGIGYFPTYTLGNLFMAQFFEKAKADISGLDESFAAGDFSPLLRWLRENIHQEGARYWSADLVEKVTGKPPTHQPLMKFLRAKYGELYNVK